MKGIFLFIKKLGVDAYDLIPAERQNKNTALPVASVLASTEFVATNRLVSTFRLAQVSTSTESVRTNSLVRESSLKPLRRKSNQKIKLSGNSNMLDELYGTGDK